MRLLQVLTAIYITMTVKSTDIIKGKLYGRVHRHSRVDRTDAFMK